MPASVSTSVPAVSNSNSASAILPGGLPPGASQLQPAGDHQVDHQEELALEREDDPLAQALDAFDPLALGRGERRHRGAHAGTD